VTDSLLMAVRAVKTDPRPSDAEQVLRSFVAARERTLALIEPLGDEQLQTVYSSIMSPLVWDLGHIAAYEDLWLCHREGGMPLLRGDLAALYDAFETPRAVRGDIEILGPEEARAYMTEVRERTVAVLGDADELICEMVLRHELQHTETMRQAMAIAGLLAPGEPALAAIDGPEEWLTVPAGSFSMGAAQDVFSYDNERPRHQVELDAFEVSRRPVTNASWLSFSEGGGYERREWWSDEGWAWKEEYDIGHHPGVASGPEQAPVCHVSWFEADAFARAHDARLPAEAEWERAATWSQQADRLAGIGSAWEWTSSHFLPYPGFQAHPYREYSEVFFGDLYRVLRGGSWATHPLLATATFRNWDLPQRRQIFSGLRLFRDAS
jgi:gamma-glutamyl hercynylcysteine S-oxide synthase